MLKVTGADAVAKRMAEIAVATTVKAELAIIQAADIVRDDAKTYVRSGPHQGQLRESIRKLDSRGSGGGLVIDVGTDVFYGRFVEYGHGGPHPAPAHSFMRKALDENREKIKRMIATALKL